MQNAHIQTGTNRFVRGATVGLVGALALVVAVAGELLGGAAQWFIPIGAAGIAMVASGLGTTIRERRSDEYTHSLWHAGTGAALATFVLVGFFLPAMMVGLREIGAAGAAPWPPIRLPIRWEAVLVCLAFFAAMGWRIRGDRG